jgi:hypothetical protein
VLLRYAGAGIYRHVWLERAPAVHIADNGVFAPATLAPGYESGAVTPSVELVNDVMESTSSGPVVRKQSYCELHNN